MNFNNLNWQPPISYSKPNSEALKALEQESKTMTREEEQSEDCMQDGEDLISRQDAIDALARSSVYIWSEEEDKLAHDWALTIIRELPAKVVIKNDK